MFGADFFFNISETDFSEIFENKLYPWEILPEIGDFIKKKTNLSELGYKEISEGVFVGKNTTIAPTASIQAPAIIGHNCEIRHCAFIRGNAIVGNNCVIGNSCEIKNSFIFNNVQIPHFNYVGDAVMGYKSHIGAGVICSNVKSIPGSVKADTPEGRIDTKLKKFSAIIGDFVEVGCNSVLNPGTLIGKNSVVYPLSNVRGYIPPDHIFKSKQEVIKKLKE